VDRPVVAERLLPAAAGPDGVDPLDLAGCLALMGDLSMGQPADHGPRAALLALGLARRAGLDRAGTRGAFVAALLRWAGCTANAAAFADLLGDDIGGRAILLSQDAERLATLAGLAELGRRNPDLSAAHCEVAQQLAEGLDLGPEAVGALGQILEQHDGGGGPRGLRGAAITPAARVASLASDTEVLVRVHGLDEARDRLHAQAGRRYDPDLVAHLVPVLADEVAALAVDSPWAAARAAAPLRRPPLGGEAVDRALSVLADFADIKSTWTVGFSRQVAGLVARAAGDAGLTAADAATATRAALVHRLGRAAVSSAIWERPGGLDDASWDQVRLVPYRTERALARCGALAGVARVASLACERLDGSGYPRGLTGPALPPAARLLAVAASWVAATSPRPHRPAVPTGTAARQLTAEAAAGRLDSAAVRAVLAAAGHRPAIAPRRGPSALTARETEVLALLVRGRRNREIAAELVLSPHTVGSHVESIYRKLGVSTRAAATVAAVRQGLVDVGG